MRAAQKASGVKPRPTRAKRSKSEPTPVPVESTKKSWWQHTPKIERPVRSKLPNVFRLTRKTYELLIINWKLLLGIVVVYGILNILLVRGFNGGIDVQELKSELSQLFSSGWGNLASGLTVFALLVSSSNTASASETASAYQGFLLLIVSLALVWVFRQLLADRKAKLRIRDSFYQGMYPLVPVILVLFVISLQLIPAVIGGLLYATVISNGIAITTPEVVGWLIVFLVTVIISLLLITPSILALFIVSLPNMTPVKALQSARKLVKFRRWAVLRKLLFLPLLILALLCAIILPIILVVPVLAQWVFFALGMLVLPAALAYVYTLYRELLNEQA